MTDPQVIDGLELAWGLIANAYGGDWSQASPEWHTAAERWRDEVWLPALAALRLSEWRAGND